MYLAMIVTSPFLIFLSSKTKGILKYILVIIGILIPCFVAGARASTVGTDMSTYGTWGYYLSKTASWSEYYQTFKGWHPIGYSFITWLVGTLFQNRIIYFGVIQACAIVPTYIAVQRCSNKDAWIGVLIYLVVIFPLSLNIMKQIIACSIALLSFPYASKKKPGLFCAEVILASLFHSTALVCLSFYPLIRLIENKNTKGAFFGRSQGIITMLLVPLSIAIFALALPYILSIASSIQSSFEYAYNNINAGSNNRTSLILLSACIIIQILINSTCSVENKYQKYDIIYLVLVGIGVILMQFDSLATSVGRLGFYGLCYITLWGTNLLSNYGEKIGIFKYIIIPIFILYGYYVYVVNGVGNVYPYQFVI